MHCPHCGCEIETRSGKPRSVEQHRRYFALIRVAFDNWPESDERQFSSPEELRAYLQMKVGYREVGAKIPLSGLNRERATMLAEAAIRAAGSYAVPVLYNDQLIVFRPKSIAFDKLKHADACKLFDDVADLIEQSIGVPAEKLLREGERVA